MTLPPQTYFSLDELIPRPDPNAPLTPKNKPSIRRVGRRHSTQARAEAEAARLSRNSGRTILVYHSVPDQTLGVWLSTKVAVFENGVRI